MKDITVGNIAIFAKVRKSPMLIINSAAGSRQFLAKKKNWFLKLKLCIASQNWTSFLECSSSTCSDGTPFFCFALDHESCFSSRTNVLILLLDLFKKLMACLKKDEIVLLSPTSPGPILRPPGAYGNLGQNDAFSSIS